MPEYIPSPRQWVRDQVELYEKSVGGERAEEGQRIRRGLDRLQTALMFRRPSFFSSPRYFVRNLRKLVTHRTEGSGAMGGDT